MPKLDTFDLEIKTGDKGRDDVPKYAINGFPLDFDAYTGGAGPSETFKAKGSPRSFPHSLTLIGPESGEWEIESMSMTYYCSGEDPYTIRIGKFTLDDQSDANIWHDAPAEVFDV